MWSLPGPWHEDMSKHRTHKARLGPRLSDAGLIAKQPGGVAMVFWRARPIQATCECLCCGSGCQGPGKARLGCSRAKTWWVGSCSAPSMALVVVLGRGPQQWSVGSDLAWLLGLRWDPGLGSVKIPTSRARSVLPNGVTRTDLQQVQGHAHTVPAQPPQPLPPPKARSSQRVRRELQGRRQDSPRAHSPSIPSPRPPRILLLHERMWGCGAP